MPLPLATTSLPPSFTSLYRLCLRATSVSVLHYNPAVKQLRALWRPTFEDGARAAHAIMRKDPSEADAARMTAWYKTFEQRVEETLAMLANSSTTRGLSHNLTKNLAVLRREHLYWFDAHYYSHSGTWNPSLPPDAPEYKPRVKRQAGKDVRKAGIRAFEQGAWSALSEVVRMAEGREGVVLGRMAPAIREPGKPVITRRGENKA